MAINIMLTPEGILAYMYPYPTVIASQEGVAVSIDPSVGG